MDKRRITLLGLRTGTIQLAAPGPTPSDIKLGGRFYWWCKIAVWTNLRNSTVREVSVHRRASLGTSNRTLGSGPTSGHSGFFCIVGSRNSRPILNGACMLREEINSAENWSFAKIEGLASAW